MQDDFIAQRFVRSALILQSVSTLVTILLLFVLIVAKIYYLLVPHSLCELLGLFPAGIV